MAQITVVIEGLGVENKIATQKWGVKLGLVLGTVWFGMRLTTINNPYHISFPRRLRRNETHCAI